MDIIINDFSSYFNWNEKRILLERETMQRLLKDATHFYNEEFKRN